MSGVYARRSSDQRERKMADHLCDEDKVDDWVRNILTSFMDDAERFAGTARPVDTEDPFVALWAERVAMKAAREEAARNFDAAYKTADEAEKDRLADADEAAYERFANVWEKIAAARPDTLFGILVKMRAFADIVGPDDVSLLGVDACTTDARLLKGVIADLERLAMVPAIAGGTSEAEDERSALQRVAHPSPPDGEPIDALEMTYFSVLTRLIQQGKAPAGEASEPYSRFLLFDTGEMKPGWAEFIANFLEAEDAVYERYRRATDEHAPQRPTSSTIMVQAQRLTDLWDEVNRLGKQQHRLSLADEAFAVEKRIAAMRARTPEEALVQLRIAASYFDLECDKRLWNSIHKLVWSATWVLNVEMGARIPFKDKYSTPRGLDPFSWTPDQLGQKGVHDVEYASALCSRVPPADGRVGPIGPLAGGSWPGSSNRPLRRSAIGSARPIGMKVEGPMA